VKNIGQNLDTGEQFLSEKASIHVNDTVLENTQNEMAPVFKTSPTQNKELGTPLREDEVSLYSSDLPRHS
jgi:hypothetical protein